QHWRKGPRRAFLLRDWGHPDRRQNMTQFTQLNLNGKSETKPAGQPTKAESQRPASTAKPASASSHNPGSHKPKTLTIVGSAIALSLMGVALLETSGCSKAAKTTIAAPTMQARISRSRRRHRWWSLR